MSLEEALEVVHTVGPCAQLALSFETAQGMKRQALLIIQQYPELNKFLQSLVIILEN